VLFSDTAKNKIRADENENTSLIEKPEKHQINQSGNQ